MSIIDSDPRVRPTLALDLDPIRNECLRLFRAANVLEQQAKELREQAERLLAL